MRKIEIQGRVFKSIKEAAEFYQIPVKTVYGRRKDCKSWDLKQIFLVPVITAKNHRTNKRNFA